jgi:hypothetical protein
LLREDDIQCMKETIAPRAAPVLSLYVDVNPGKPENDRRAWLIRVKDALKALPVPHDLEKKFIEKLEVVRPEARTYAAFAVNDLMEIYELQVDLPLVDLAQGRVDARWGDPYVFPLLYVIDESERHGVVFIDESKWRFFEVFLGEIEEIANAFLDLSDEKSPELPRPAQHFVQGVILRGGAAGDRFARHIEAWVQRFYKRIANVLDKLTDTHQIDRLILMGPHEDTHLFAEYLSRRLRQRLAGHISSLPKPGASAGEVLKRVAPAIENSRQAQELALLQEVRDYGRWTIPTVLEALQMGRLYLLIAPWRLDAVVWRCASGLVVQDQQAIEAFCPGQEAKQVELRDVLPDLATAHGARLQFVEREAEAHLLREFGGLAGLPRW